MFVKIKQKKLFFQSFTFEILSKRRLKSRGSIKRENQNVSKRFVQIKKNKKKVKEFRSLPSKFFPGGFQEAVNLQKNKIETLVTFR